MVPLIWAFFSADVNAGTASAARIAIIAITTSNSMSVNAEEGLFIFSFISILVSFFLRLVLRVLARHSFMRRRVFSEGFGFRVVRGVLALTLKRGLSQGFRIKSMIIFYYFWRLENCG